MYIIVIGAGKVGYYLTKTLLADNHEVLLLEKDAAKAARLAEELGEVVAAGDGCEVRTQREIGMNRADVVVAVTGDDEDNLIACQLAKRQFGVGRTLARVNNPRNEEIFNLLGVDASVSGTRLIYSMIEQEVETGEVVPLTALMRGEIEIVEAELSDRSPVVGKALKDIHLPGDSVMAAIIRNNHIVLPSGTTELEAGDCVITLTRPGDEASLRNTLTGKE